MTTTTTSAPDPERKECPRCKASTLEKVPDVDAWHCDGCGYTEGTVQPDEIHPPGEAPRAQTEPEPGPEALDQNAALEAAVETALSSPGVPGREEFLTLAQTARMLSMSPLVPKFLRGNPAACFHLAMIGRDLGISPTSACDLIDVIPDDANDPSKGGRASLSPELLNGQVARHGLGTIAPLLRTSERCVAVALAPGGGLDFRCTAKGEHWEGANGERCECHGILGQTEFTWEDARIAGLVQPGTPSRYGQEREACQPGDHKPYERNANGKRWTACDCRQGYITYPKRMLWWRAAGFAQSDFMPQASLGLYSAEELGAVVDENGRMIDPAQIALPEGFEPEAPPPPPAADDADIAEIRTRVNALPAEHRTAFLARWEEKVAEGRLSALPELLASQVAIAKALVNGAEANAKNDGWKPGAPAAAEAPSEAGRQPDTGVPETGQAESPSEPQTAPGGTDVPAAPASPQGNPGQPAPDGMAADLAIQYGRARPELTTALAEGAIAVVTKMTAKALNGALRAREMATDGEEVDRRRHLAEAMAMEQAEQDWKAANTETPEEGS